MSKSVNISNICLPKDLSPPNKFWSQKGTTCAAATAAVDPSFSSYVADGSHKRCL